MLSFALLWPVDMLLVSRFFSQNKEKMQPGTDPRLGPAGRRRLPQGRRSHRRRVAASHAHVRSTGGRSVVSFFFLARRTSEHAERRTPACGCATMRLAETVWCCPPSQLPSGLPGIAKAVPVLSRRPIRHGLCKSCPSLAANAGPRGCRRRREALGTAAGAFKKKYSHN